MNENKESEKMNKQLKVFKVFYDEDAIKECPQYEMLFSERKPYQLYDRLANYNVQDCDTNFISKIITSTFEFLIKNLSSIDGLFIKFDIEALIVSAVIDKIRENRKLRIKCPSYESVFLCNHKYYQRTRESHPVQFSYIDIDDTDDLFDCNELPKFPFILKAPELQMSIHQYIIHNAAQLKKVKSQLRCDLPKYNAETKYINQSVLNLGKYPLAIKNIMICEEFVSDCLQVNWEGWADYNGTITTYGFTDEILADYGIFSEFIMPSILPSAALEKCENICKEFLRSISFKNSFVNIELWVKKTNLNDIRIIEVNPRSAYPYYAQYQTSYHGTNLYDSIIQLSMGHTNIGVIPDLQTNFTGLYSCQSVFATRCNGKISELLNFENIEEEMQKNKDYRFFFLFTDRNFEIIKNEQSGARVLMRIYFTAETYKKASNESLRLKKLFLVKDNYYMNSPDH